jgi:Asp-tRNA(Asn)/Glu-tRNA(Gln) amidotransferase B subunit
LFYAVFQIKAGEKRAIDFLMGQVMKKTQGKADPKKVREMIKNRFTV